MKERRCLESRNKNRCLKTQQCRYRNNHPTVKNDGVGSFGELLLEILMFPLLNQSIAVSYDAVRGSWISSATVSAYTTGYTLLRLPTISAEFMSHPTMGDWEKQGEFTMAMQNRRC
ncbi:MAG: hypothetical protein CM15mP68_0210 [Pseudomonadota bacterium]|nr:MAG: hypothetical protein CM15mP68_0210 [Pseudomonadota bacterium]